MKKIDFIVHPEMAILSKSYRSAQDFSEDIKKVAYGRKDCYVISSKYLPTFSEEREELFWRLHSKNLVGRKRILKSRGIEKNGDYYPFGYVCAKDLKKLEKILAEGFDEIRVHGCFYGDACLSNFSIQAYFLEVDKQYPGIGNEDSKTRDIILDNIKSGIIENFGLLGRSKIKYGVVFNPRKSFDMNFRRVLPKLPFVKNLDEQLCDENTIIHVG